MNYDPQILEIFQQMAGTEIPAMHTLSPTEARELTLMMSKKEHIDEVQSVQDFEVNSPHGPISARIYKPLDATDEPLPIIIFYHGGGWVIGSVESYDPMCRTLTNGFKSIVVSVDYHLSPEYKFPVAVDDSFAALQWVLDHAEEIGGNPTRILVAGDSAGGNLAAVTAIKAKEANIPLIGQILIYPTTGVGHTESYEKFGAIDPMIPIEAINWFRNHYRNNDQDLVNPYHSPYLYEDITGVAPAYIMTADMDPTLDDGKLYAEKLKNANVPVIYKEYKGLPHGFLSFETVDVVKKAYEELFSNIQEMIHHASEVK